MSKLSYEAVEHEDELITLREQVDIARNFLLSISKHEGSVANEVLWDLAWYKYDALKQAYEAAVKKRVML